MADVSGFTALSERLATAGEEGAEKLTVVINRFFERILQAAAGFGGDTLTFAGDAVLLLFCGDGHAVRAVHAGRAMLATTAKMRAADILGHNARLGMSIGVHSAVFALVISGLADGGLHLFALGPETESVAKAEGHAQKGQMAITPATSSLLGGAFPLGQTDAGVWLVAEPGGEIGPGPPAAHKETGSFRPRQIDQRDASRHLPFLPPWVAASARSGEQALVSAPEHRRVSVVFVNVAGVNEIMEYDGPDALAAELQTYVARLLGLLHRHHGYLVSTDIATDGFKLLLTFGAPVAHEYAAANAARFALEFDSQVRSGAAGRLRHRMGLNGGHVFAGEIGPSFRRQYTVMGDEVNVAARMMAAAQWGQVLATKSFADHAGPRFCGKVLDPIRVKGKAEPIEVCLLEQEVGPVDRPAVRRTRMFGRDAELRMMADAWTLAQAGGGSSFLIQGEAGQGKTRLVDEAIEGLGAKVRVVRTACYEHLQAAPLAPWIEALDSIFSTSRAQSVADRQRRIGRWIKERAPEMKDFRCLLNPLAAVSFPTSAVVRSLDVPSRQQRLFQLLACIVHRAGDGDPVVMLFEDIHWADETSLEVLKTVAESAPEERTLLLITARPRDPAYDLGSQTLTIVLTELSEADACSMLRQVLKAPELPQPVLSAVYEKTRGNPLFLEEVSNALLAPGVLDRILGASSIALASELATLEIPDRVQGLLMVRIDGLPPRAREVLKVGSVAGRSFSEPLLMGIDDAATQAVSLTQAFAELASSGLVVTETADAAPALRFRHALIQEVAYDSLPFARRRRLHRSLARFLETYTEPPDHGLLVHHYKNCGDSVPLQVHAVAAARGSASVYAYREASDYMGTAIGAVRGRTKADALLRARLEEVSGDYLEAMARHDEAIRSYRKARTTWIRARASGRLVELPPGAPPVPDIDAWESELCHKIATSAERRHSDYRVAQAWLQRAQRSLPPGRQALESHILISRSVVDARVGRYQEAMRSAEPGVALARQTQDKALQAYALTTYINPCIGLGLFQPAMQACEEAVGLYQEVGDLAGEASSRGNLAICYHALGDLQNALAQHELSWALHQRLGYSTGAAITQNNLAELLLTFGRVDEAAEHLEQVVARSSHSPALKGCAFLNLGRAHLRSGRLDQAGSSLAAARSLLTESQAAGLLLEAELEEAKLALAGGRADEAAERGCAVHSKASAAGSHFTRLNALLFTGEVEIVRGDLEAAKEHLTEGLELARAMEAVYEEALALLALARVHSASAPVTARDTLEQAITIFERMGASYDLERAQELRLSLE
jgi:class 3 adenylate cyclase/tetratricopeptide (TPR) repeat protein